MDNRTIGQERTKGHCVICGVEGTSEHDFICSECGDPLCATLFCSHCHRRLNLDQESARAFLSDYGYEIDEVAGLIIKINRCGNCISSDETADLEIYRIHFDKNN